MLTTDAYDANGNTTVNASIGNAYDFENHLIQHGAVTIVYDAMGGWPKGKRGVPRRAGFCSSVRSVAVNSLFRTDSQ